MVVTDRCRLAVSLLLLLTFLLTCQGTTTYIVSLDEFEESQPRLSTFNAANLWNAVESTSIVGMERDMLLVKTVSSPSRNYVEVLEGRMQTSDEDGHGNYTIQYDGCDNSPEVDINGLGGLDFTKDGGAALAFESFTLISASVTLLVYSPDGGMCSWTNNDVHVGVQYATFTDFNGDCDWTSVGAVELVQPMEDYAGLSVYWLRISGDPAPPTAPPASELHLLFNETQVFTIPPHVTFDFNTKLISSSSESSIAIVCQSSDQSACLYERLGQLPTPFDYDNKVCASASNPMVVEIPSTSEGYYYGSIVTQDVYTTVALTLFDTSTNSTLSS